MAGTPQIGPAARPSRAVNEAAVLFGAVAAAVTAYVVAYPFTQVHYAPITDLPFHAAQTSIFRHYFDPAYHFREQFSLHPLEVPYLSMYGLGALFACFVSIATATKLMAIVMLLLVPAGLAVFFHGMKKTPLWGLAGLSLVWCNVTQWGFLNFMGAIGLFAMSVGFAMLVVDQPSRPRQWGLALSLVAIFLTHIYRFPWAVAGVCATGIAMYPATRRFRPLLGPLAPALFLFAVWLLIKPRGIGADAASITFGFHPERFAEIPRHLFGSYLPLDGAPPTAAGDLERSLARHLLAVLAFAIVASFAVFFSEGRHRERSATELRWGIGVTVVPLALAAALLAAYLTLPLEAGQWFYVYPREIVAAALFAVGMAPDLPRSVGQRLVFVALFVVAATPMSRFVASRFHEFEAATADFREILADIPASPRLFYLVYWLGGSEKRVPPFLHLPAWVQAEKGGALGFHFVQWSHSPIRYRKGSPDVPPPFQERFEWEPQYFDVGKHGPWFDTFLVRHRQEPHELFDPDPSIRLVSHRGTWWLYRRSPGALPGRIAR